jgi:hypothetical protein
MTMKNATGISRWTSAGRNHAVHILNDEGSLVLCKKQFFTHETEALDIEKVTCKRCATIFKNLNKALVIKSVCSCENANKIPTVNGHCHYCYKERK